MGTSQVLFFFPNFFFINSPKVSVTFKRITYYKLSYWTRQFMIVFPYYMSYLLSFQLTRDSIKVGFKESLDFRLFLIDIKDFVQGMDVLHQMTYFGSWMHCNRSYRIWTGRRKSLLIGCTKGWELWSTIWLVNVLTG